MRRDSKLSLNRDSKVNQQLSVQIRSVVVHNYKMLGITFSASKDNEVVMLACWWAGLAPTALDDIKDAFMLCCGSIADKLTCLILKD